jgi:MFS family permease
MKMEKLWNKNFTLLVIGQIMSLFGNMVVTTVLPFHILYISGSEFLFGLSMGLPVISLILVTPIGGVMADRLKKHRLMFWLDVSVTGVIVAYLSGLFTEAVPVIIVKLLAFNAIQAIYMATAAASISQLTPPEKLNGGNAIIQIVNMLSMTGGMAIAGVLYDRFGLIPILVGCAVCFVVTALVDLLIRIPFEARPSGGSISQTVKSDLSEALRFVTKEKPRISKLLLPLFFMEMIFSSMIMIGLPVIITVHLGMSMSQVGIALAVMMFGGVAGGIVAGALGSWLTIPRGLIFVFLGIILSTPIGFVLLVDISPTLAYIIIVTAGTLFMLSVKIVSVAMLTFVQTETPPTLIGKVLAVLMVVPFVGQSLGYPVQGILFQTFAGFPWVVIFACAGIMLVVIAASYKYFSKG